MSRTGCSPTHQSRAALIGWVLPSSKYVGLGTTAVSPPLVLSIMSRHASPVPSRLLAHGESWFCWALVRYDEAMGGKSSSQAVQIS